MRMSILDDAKINAGMPRSSRPHPRVSHRECGRSNLERYNLKDDGGNMWQLWQQHHGFTGDLFWSLG